MIEVKTVILIFESSKYSEISLQSFLSLQGNIWKVVQVK